MLGKKLIVSLLLLQSFITPVSSVQAQSNISRIMETMSVKEKVTQTIMPDFRNWKEGEEEIGVTHLNEEITSILSEYRFGGVILFAENVVNTTQTADLVKQFQTTMVESQGVPLLLTIDQEGGIVNRLGTGTSLPGNMALAATQSVDNAKAAGDIIGKELSSLGINVNFAPVMDVNNNPNNSVIGLRSFSSNPDIVSKMGKAYIEGIQQYPVATAAKHFPGHGDTDVDTHYGLSVVDKSREDLDKTEFPPFKVAIEAGVDMLMTAHIQYPQLETTLYKSKLDGSEMTLPATLSPAILTGIVREEWKYDGIIVTDAMNMQAISDHFGESDAAVMAKKAGADIILMPTIIRSKADMKKMDDIIEAMVKAVEAGEITKDNLDTSVERILKLKEKLGLLDADYLERLEQENPMETVGHPEHRATERRISREAITLIGNETHVLPMQPTVKDHIVFVVYGDEQVAGPTFSIERMVSEGYEMEASHEVVFYTEEKPVEDLIKAIEPATHVVVMTSMANAKSLMADNFRYAIPQQLFDQAKADGKVTIQISTNKPYDAVAFNNVDATLIAYGYKGMDPTEAGKEPTNAFGANIPATVEVLFGYEVPEGPTGTLPVDLPAVKDGVLQVEEILYKIGEASKEWK